MNPWIFEADAINLNQFSSKDLESYIVITPEVNEFLQYGQADKKYFIVAPKGIGKTLLLRAKSQIYRDKDSSFKCLPVNELVEKFTLTRTDFSNKDLTKFEDLNIWEKIWEICLISYILQNFNIELPDEIERVIGAAKRLPDILASLLNNRNLIDKLHWLVPTHLKPKLSDLPRAGINQVAIFIDNIDESFEDHTGYNLKGKYNSQNLSEKIWVNSQVAIMRVARDICVSNRHINIFISIRSEALESNKTSTSLQMEQYITYLKYSKKQVKKIFEQKINSTPKGSLFNNAQANPSEKFLGFSKIPHRFVVESNSSPKEEEIFDYIYRHTFGRPREIVKVGNEIVALPPSDRDIGAIHDIVNKVSFELLEQYKKEIVPYFQDDIFQAF